MSRAIAICWICKKVIQVHPGREKYRVVKKKPRCMDCYRIHGSN